MNYSSSLSSSVFVSASASSSSSNNFLISSNVCLSLQSLSNSFVNFVLFDINLSTPLFLFLSDKLTKSVNL